MISDLTFDFFVLAGDANRDRKVDIMDLTILAQNWHGNNKNFSSGEFNYDSKVNAADLGIIATQWQKMILPPPVVTPVGSIGRRSPVRAIRLIE